MAKTILSANQQQFLPLFSTSKFSKNFYLTGGTALAEHYIQYRKSEDLDFFSEIEIDAQSIAVFLKSIKKKLDYNSFDLNTSFNRNIIHLLFAKETLKLEFTYFPFPQIEKPLKKEGVLVDSVLDIAVNKLFTIYQKPRSRDYIDLYMVNKKYGFEIEKLLKNAKIKFDWHIDPIKLGAQFLEADKVRDYPILFVPLKKRLWVDYFKSEAKKLESAIFK